MIPFRIFFIIWIILGIIQIYLLYRIYKRIYLIRSKPSFSILSLEFFRFLIETIKIQKTTQDNKLKILLYSFFITFFIAIFIFLLGFFGIIPIYYY